MAAGASEDNEVSQHLESSNDSSVDHKVSEPKPLEISGLITAFNQSKIVDIKTSPVVINLDKIAVKESLDKIDLASTGDSKPSFSSSNTSTSFKKHAVLSPCKLRSRVIQIKENNAPENPMVSGTCMVNRQRVVHKPLDVPINHNSSITPTVKEVYNVNYHVNTVRARGSKVKVHSDQVKTSTSSEALSSNRKSLAEHVLKPAPTQLKQKMDITRANIASMRKSVGQKKISKMKTPAFSQRNGTKSISTSPALLKTSSRVNMTLHPSYFWHLKCMSNLATPRQRSKISPELLVRLNPSDFPTLPNLLQFQTSNSSDENSKDTPLTLL